MSKKPSNSKQNQVSDNEWIRIFTETKLDPNVLSMEYILSIDLEFEDGSTRVITLPEIHMIPEDITFSEMMSEIITQNKMWGQHRLCHAGIKINQDKIKKDTASSIRNFYKKLNK